MDENVEDNNKNLDGHGAVGHIRPATSIPRRRKNRSKYTAKKKRVGKSWGYDCDGSSNVPGGIFPVRPTSCDWRPAEKVAQFAALKQAEDGGTPLEYRQLVKVNMCSVGGIMYYLTFTARDTIDGREKIFKAKVMCDARDISLHLKEFKVDNDPNKSAEKMRNEVVDVLEKIAAFRKENPHLFHVLPPRPPAPDRSGERKLLGVYFTPKKGVLAAMGFRIFLKDMRTQNPTWKYAKVRKAASRKWKSNITNKVPYLNKALPEFSRKAVESWKRDGKVPNNARSKWSLRCTLRSIMV